MAFSFYKESVNVSSINEINLFPFTIVEDSFMLTSPFSAEEVKATFFGMDPFKILVLMDSRHVFIIKSRE